jgi:hypothetical protein
MAFQGSKFSDRASASAAAKQALLEKFKQRPAPDDPAMLALAAERRAIAEAREVRAAERRAAKEAEAARLREEERLREIERKAAEAEAQRLAVQERARQLQLLADQKAERDRRYAARKARR